jgi:Uma2 family endonuclease
MCATVASAEMVVFDDVMPDMYDVLHAALPECPFKYRPRLRSLEMPMQLEDVTWTAYEQVLHAFSDRRFRHAYDRGTLEIAMSPGKDHDWIKKLIGRMIEAMCLDQEIGIQSMGSTTLHRRKLRNGVEPDESYYVTNEPRVRGKIEYDPDRDPPPDLAIEVDVSSKSARRFATYGRLGVPEIWCWDGASLRFFRRKRDGEYVETDHSLSFPLVSPADVERCLRMFDKTDENSVIRAFVKWARNARGLKRRPPKS